VLNLSLRFGTQDSHQCAVKFTSVTEHKLFRPAVGAALAMFFGLALRQMPLGEAWENASYDYLFRFGARAVTNKVVLILMDNEAYDRFHQVRGRPWDRALHTNLLNKLATDGCPLVVLDLFFRMTNDPAVDEALARAMRHQGRVVLMAEQASAAHPALLSARPTLPVEPFLSASTNWGVAWLDSDRDSIVRKHWPFPAPGPYPSLPWTAARLVRAQLRDVPQEQWLRFYGQEGCWESLSYPFALTKPPNYFHERIVFVGNKPKTPIPDGEQDEFRTPYTRWTGESTGGVEILATEFLNLMNGDWLRRPPKWMEVLMLVIIGVLLGGALCRVSPLVACGTAAGVGLTVMLGAITLSYISNYWFPWLTIAGGQVPCALAWALVSRWRGEGIVSIYEVAQEPFGKGAYGEVFLARHKKTGLWFAFKKVYRAKFNDPGPYEREFRGITRYLPVSSQHPGLLHVHYVGRDEGEAYFFYVMDLGDPQVAGWEKNPSAFKPCDLALVRAQTEQRRLPVQECVRIVLALAEALDFLHQQGLIHRDIKPSNIIFLKGQPKLADVGLVTEIQPPGKEGTWIGTPGYMPPPPEPPGTVQADIYGLGMVLYVISTGRDPAFFPELSTTLVEKTSEADFIRLNPIILKACQPNHAERYASVAEMRADLLELQRTFACDRTTQRV
jgi:CHASE2 domain-containing sensor protein